VKHLKRTVRSVPILVAGALIALQGARSWGDDGDKVALRLRLEKGKAYGLRMVAEQEITQTIQGQQQTMNQTVGTDYVFAVRDVGPDGTYAVTVTYKAVRFRQTSPVGTVAYDSASPPEVIPPMARGFAALVGQNFGMKVSDQGRVTEVTGVDAMLTRMISELHLPAGPMQDAVSESLRAQFGDEAIREMMESMMAIYPDQPVAVGDSWSKEVVVSRGFPMIIQNQWTLTGRRDGLAQIAVKSSIKPNEEGAPTKMGPMSLKYNMSGTQDGTLNMIEATGWTQRAAVKQEFTGQVAFSGGPGGDAGQNISWPISVTGTVTFEPLEEM
jgi:hypothetical protein